MRKELEVIDRYDQMNKVVQEYLKGENATQIAKSTGLRRVDVLGYLEEWRNIAKNDEGVRDRAKEALMSMDEHYALIIKEMWETITQADLVGDLKIRAAVLKNIADIEKARVETLQKAGLYEDASMGDELAEMERKQDILIKILREVTSSCPNCKWEVSRRLQDVTGKVEAVKVDSVVIGGTPTP